jgi:drug/metabolite transporter (DMT)-like permease
MNIILLISIILGVSFQNIIKKPYSIKAGGKGVYFFCLLTSLAAMLFFAVTAGRFEWDTGIVPYAFLFAVSYAAASIFSLEAVSCGPLSLSSLVISYSLLLPTLYGLIFLKDPIRPALIPGLVLLVVSLFLINQKNDSAPITFKWIIFVVLAFFGNGICTIAQNMQQREFDGAYKNEFMIIALAIVALVLLFFVIVKEGKTGYSFGRKGRLASRYRLRNRQRRGQPFRNDAVGKNGGFYYVASHFGRRNNNNLRGIQIRLQGNSHQASVRGFYYRHRFDSSIKHLI